MGEVRNLKAADLRRWEKYFHARNERHLSVEKAAAYARLSASTAYRFERGDPASGGIEAASRLGVTEVAGSVVSQPLSAEAAQALEDFAYFRLRVMGRRSTPWQERAAYDVLRAVQSPEREFIVNNEPPGSGKSTLFTHDIPCWLIARDRTIRIMVGSRTERQARMYVGRIKKTLERDAPMRASADDLAYGQAFDAVSTMTDDYTAFKPEGRSELWRAEGLTVRQLDGVSLDDKEPTVSAWGMDSGFLGGRFDLVLWDDLVDAKNTRGLDAKDKTREWYTTEAETRLEPGGAFILQGQRIAHDDLYAFAKAMVRLDGTPKYRAIIYPAHHEDRCTGHSEAEMKGTETPPPWPEGCLLDPYRLPMRELEVIRHNNPRVFEVQYQQNDGDLVGGLIEAAWVTGGVDSDGYPAPGCLDRERDLREVPAHLTDGRGWSFVTVDPSPTEYWGVIWWLYDPATNLRYVLDVLRRRMDPEDFLSLDLTTFAFTGWLEELRRFANSAHCPLDLVMFERNGAQDWFLHQPMVQRWMDATDIPVVGHVTTVRKWNTDFGLESIGDLFRQGMVRLPHKSPTARLRVNDLLREGYAYPDVDTTDLLMATWFHKLAVENYYRPRTVQHALRPGWGREVARGLPGYRRGLASAGR